MNSLTESAALLLGTEISKCQTLSGGDLSDVLKLTLTDGRHVIVKGGPDPKLEAAMLRAMAGAGAKVPDVLAASDQVLVLQALDSGGGLSADGWATFGHDLHRLHGTQGSCYGWPRDYAFGLVPIPNSPTSDWVDFWAANRLAPSMSHVPNETAKRLQRVIDALGTMIPAHPSPSLLHGDLWMGNVLTDDRYIAMIDPACYFGDAEVDLAMLSLFSTPPAAFYSAYGPLSDGWEIRRAVYQLWPALVHVRLFGAGYLGLLDGLLRRVGV